MMVIQLSKEMQQFIEKQTTERGYQSADECVDDLLRTVKQRIDNEAMLAERQRKEISHLVEQIQKNPSPMPQDGLTGRDHDKILYDREQK